MLISPEYQCKQSSLPTKFIVQTFNYTGVPKERVSSDNLSRVYSTNNLNDPRMYEGDDNIYSSLYISNKELCKILSFVEVTSVLENQQSQIQNRLRDLTSLKNGWDGLGSVPVSQENADFALELTKVLFRSDLPAPSIFPIGDGTLQIEWHCNGYEVELDVVAPNDINAGRLNLSSGAEEDIKVTDDLATLSSWIDDLVANKNHIHNDG